MSAAKARVAAFAGAAAFGAAAVGMAAPAYAADDDPQPCYWSTGTIAVTHAGAPVDSAPSGTDLTVSWTVDASCQDYVIFMAGPGFSGFEQVTGNQRNVWATAPAGSHSMTWTLEMVALDASSPFPLELASRTITVT